MKPAPLKAHRRPHKRIDRSFETLNRIGFTLTELLIVVAILGILATAVLVAVNPAKRLYQAKVAGALHFAKQIDNLLAFEAVGQ